MLLKQLSLLLERAMDAWIYGMYLGIMRKLAQDYPMIAEWEGETMGP